MNETDRECPSFVTEYVRPIMVSLVVMFMPISALGNLVIIVAVGRTKSLRTNVNILIVSVATIDILSTLCLQPLDVLYYLNFPRYPHSPIITKLWNALFFALVTSSVLNLCAINLERFIALKFALKYFSWVTSGKIYLCILCIWLYSLTTFLVIAFLQNTPKQGQFAFLVSDNFYLGLLVLNIILPMSVSFSAALYISCVARRHLREIRAMGRAYNFSTFPESLSSENGQKDLNGLGKNTNSTFTGGKRGTLKMLCPIRRGKHDFNPGSHNYHHSDQISATNVGKFKSIDSASSQGPFTINVKMIRNKELEKSPTTDKENKNQQPAMKLENKKKLSSVIKSSPKTNFEAQNEVSEFSCEDSAKRKQIQNRSPLCNRESSTALVILEEPRQKCNNVNFSKFESDVSHYQNISYISKTTGRARTSVSLNRKIGIASDRSDDETKDQLAKNRVSMESTESSTMYIDQGTADASPSGNRSFSICSDNKHQKRRVARKWSSMRKEFKTLRLVVILSFCFFLCWCPFLINQFLIINNAITYTCLVEYLDLSLGWLTYLNSIINVFIYAGFNKDFRGAYKRVICGLVWRKKNRTS